MIATTKEEAAAIAALLNADQLARQVLGQSTTFDAEDVLRLGRVVAEYIAEKPTPKVAFTAPKREPLQHPAYAGDATFNHDAAALAGFRGVEEALR